MVQKTSLNFFLQRSFGDQNMFGFCQIGTSKCGFIWIGKKLFHFDFEQKKIINEYDFDAHIIGEFKQFFCERNKTKY